LVPDSGGNVPAAELDNKHAPTQYDDLLPSPVLGDGDGGSTCFRGRDKQKSPNNGKKSDKGRERSGSREASSGSDQDGGSVNAKLSGKTSAKKSDHDGGSVSAKMSGKTGVKESSSKPHGRGTSREPEREVHPHASSERYTSEASDTHKASVVEVDDEEIEAFMERLFAEYGGTKDNRGRPLMNNPGLRTFYSAFFCEDDPAKITSDADSRYDIEIERQMDMHFRFDLSKAECKRGLCYKAFLVLLDQTTQRCVSRRIARKWYHCYAGDAKKMQQSSSRKGA
jgi:hypothetical protein